MTPEPEQPTLQQPSLRAPLPLAKRLNRNALTVAAALAGVTVLTVLVVTNPSHAKTGAPVPAAVTTPTPAQPTFLDVPPQPPSPTPSPDNQTPHVQTPVAASAPATPIPPMLPGVVGPESTSTASNSPASVSGGVSTAPVATVAQPSVRYQAYQAALMSGVLVGTGLPVPPTSGDSLAEPLAPVAETTYITRPAERRVIARSEATKQSPSVALDDADIDNPYILRAGTLIPGLLITGINSDLPGNILGQTSRDVYDTRTEQQLLIPKGSRLIGTYDNRSVGTGRLIVAWTRLIFPDGESIQMPRLLGTDVAGQSGLHDEVNHHYGRIYGSALLLSIISAGAQLSQPQQSSAYAVPSARQVAAGAAGQEMTEVAADNIRKNMDIPPTITIKPGQPFDVFLTSDVAFDGPYHLSDLPTPVAAPASSTTP